MLEFLLRYIDLSFVWVVKIFVIFVCLGVIGEIVFWVIFFLKVFYVVVEEGLFFEYFVKENVYGVFVYLMIVNGIVVIIWVVVFILSGGGNNFLFFVVMLLIVVIYLMLYFMFFVGYLKLVFKDESFERVY